MITPRKSLLFICSVAAFAIVAVVLSNIGFFWKRALFVLQGNNAQPPVHRVKNLKTEPNVLEIPSLGIRAPIVYVDVESEKVFQDALAFGVVHYPKTAMPGQVGNMYIFGHSSDFVWNKGKYKTVFALLPKINKGDVIYVTDGTATEFAYTVYDTVVAAPDDIAQLSQNTREKILSVQTSYPIGTALKRFIVKAKIAP